MADYQGTSGNDAFDGTSERDRMYGYGGNDILNGLGGNDVLSGGAGDNRLNGGDGDDFLFLSGTNDIVDGGSGIDYIFTDFRELTSGVDIDLRPLAIGGTGNVSGNIIDGIEAVLATTHTLTNYDDYLYVGDIINYRYRTATYIDYAGWNLLGGDDLAFGGKFTDGFGGGDGDDTLNGEGGDDFLIGNAGRDTLNGGDGDDQIEIDLLDSVDGGAGTDAIGFYFATATAGIMIDLRGLESGGVGVIGGTTVVNVEELSSNGVNGTSHFDDIVFLGELTAASYGPGFAFNLNAGNDTATGGSRNDNLDGSAGDDILDGAGGNDRLFGGPGSDILRGGLGNDLLSRASGANNWFDIVGLDTADYADASRAVEVSLLIEEAQNTRGAGVDTLRSIAHLNGSAFDDTLTGNNNYGTYSGQTLFNILSGLAGNDTLIALAGNDTLDGGAGRDTMIGGTGDDLYLVDEAADIVTERAGEGVDTVRTTAATLTLAAEVETLTFVGTGAFTGTGNALANTIIGGAAADVLSGGAGNDRLDGGGGADRLIGGVGDDLYLIDDAGDVIVEQANAGYDTVETALAHQLGGAIDALVFTGTAAVNGIGNALSNAITGNSAANVLSGQAGADLLRGAEGDDSLNGGLGGDTLEGGAGDDRITGGADRDTLTGGTGADRFTFVAGDSSADRQFADRITDFSRADGDKIVLRTIDADTATAGDQNFTFIGSAAFGNSAGELRVVTTNAFTYAEGDVNGDGVADFSIRLNGTVALVAADFAL